MINFQKCTDKAYEILLSQKDSNIPVNISNLTLDYPIIFESLQRYSSITNIPIDILTCNQKADNGYLFKHGDFTIILHNELHCAERCNFTDGHELGHIVLGHKKDSPDEEVEANFFSAQTIMPTAFIRYLHQNQLAINQFTLQKVFRVSKPAAHKKIITIKKYFEPHRWDKDLVKKYQDSLDKFLYIDTI